jgi:phage terminase large subunit GpA-like protein
VIAPAVWTPGELEAWRPREILDPAAWAEQERKLGEDESSTAGDWDNSIAPYLVEPMRALGNPRVSLVALMMGAQVGKSECARNWLGQRADQEPGPAMILFPDRPSAMETLAERIVPMFRNTPALRRLLTNKPWDVKAKQLRLRTHRIRVAWATSVQTVATNPIRDLVCDETDKYPPTAAKGKEGDPLTLAFLRLTTFKHRGKACVISTPTTKHGPIYGYWSSSADRRRFHVPCRACGLYQTLKWDGIHFRGRGSSSLTEWRAIAAEATLGERDVFYGCEACGERHDERAKRTMLRLGRWQSEGHEPGDHPRSASVAFHLSSLASPWVTWAKLVAEFHRAKLLGLLEVHGFRNGRLAEVADDEADGIRFEASRILHLAARGHPRGVAPSWTTAIISTADTQRGGWRWVTRAWGTDGRSRLLAYGWAKTEGELRRDAVLATYPVEGAGRPAGILLLLVNPRAGAEDDDELTGDRVARFAATDPDRIQLVRGHGGSFKAASRIRTVAASKGLPAGVKLWVACTQSYKTLLAGRVRQDDPGVWEVSSVADQAYADQMASEELVPETVGGRVVYVWQKRAAGGVNDLWDCETYQCAAADILEVDTLAPLRERLAAEQEARRGPVIDQQSWWDGTRPGGWR